MTKIGHNYSACERNIASVYSDKMGHTWIHHSHEACTRWFANALLHASKGQVWMLQMPTSYKNSRSVRPPSSLGKVPVSLFPSTSILLSLVRTPSSLGRLPVRRLSLLHIRVRPVRAPSSLGSVPVNRFSLSHLRAKPYKAKPYQRAFYTSKQSQPLTCKVQPNG